MSNNNNLSPLNLASFISSKLCHDLISPTTALVNGFEVLDMDNDKETEQMAMGIIRRSAESSSARLQFYRLSLGSSGGPGGSISLSDAQRVTEGLFEHEKHSLAWELEPRNIEKSFGRLLLNLITLALHNLPRGGEIAVRERSNGGIILGAAGPNAITNEETLRLLQGEEPSELTAHIIIPVVCALLAEEAKVSISVTTTEHEVTYHLKPQ